MNFHLPKLDLFSFFAGFTLATIFWLIVLRISKLAPKMKKSKVENRQKQNSKQNITREHAIRLFTLRKAQSHHLASALFPLNNVLVEPSVIAPPDSLPGFGEEDPTYNLTLIFPYAPEVPDLSADVPVQRIDLKTLVDNYPYVCLSGLPGTGKSTALSTIAGKLSADESNEFAILIPAVFLTNNDSPVAISLFDYVQNNVSGLTQETVEEIITQATQSGRLVVLIDDLDELNREEFDKAVDRVKELQGAFPGIRIVVTAGAFYTGGLTDAGFDIFSLSAWSRPDRKKLIKSWENAFFEATKSGSQEEMSAYKSRLERTRLWLLQDETDLSPIELTIKIWLSLADAIQTSQQGFLVDSYLKYISDNYLIPECFVAVAEEMEKAGTRVLKREKVAEILNSRSDYLIRDASRRISSKEIVELLVDNHLFLEQPDESLKFSNVSFLGYLRSQSASNTSIPGLKEVLCSSLQQSSLMQRIPSETNLTLFLNWLDQNDSPIFRNFLVGLNWLKYTYPGDMLRNEIYKRTARLLQDRSIPMGLRARFMNFMAITQDPSIFSLFTILKGNRDPIVRRIVALGLGMFSDEKAVAALNELSKDEDKGVQNMTLLSLGRIWTIPAQDVLVSMIFTADESIRSNTCEILATHVPDGHEMLKEIMTTDNYLARKAAIAGFTRINEPWVREILEKTSVEDTQWVVRDSAIFALEHFGELKPFTPEKWLPVYENPWTLEKAEQYGMQLSPKIYPSEILLKVLDQGSDHDRKIALHYLLKQPTHDLVKWLNLCAKREDAGMRDDAINALLSLSKRGLDIT